MALYFSDEWRLSEVVSEIRRVINDDARVRVGASTENSRSGADSVQPTPADSASALPHLFYSARQPTKQTRKVLDRVHYVVAGKAEPLEDRSQIWRNYALFNFRPLPSHPIQETHIVLQGQR